MEGVKTFVLTASSLTLLSLTIAWYRNKSKKAEERIRLEKILSSPNTSWKKVGRVKEIFCYPLKSGKSKAVEECIFDEYGISFDEGVSFIKDRMFIVYDEKTKKFQTGRQHPKLLLVTLNLLNEREAQLEVAGMSPLKFSLPKTDEKPINCTMWFGEPVKCLDCGDEVSKWLSKYLLERDSGMKLGIFIPDKHRVVTKGVWEEYAKMYSAMRNEDTGLFSDLASYMLMSESSVNDLNERLKKPISPRQLRPNIVVEGCNPYAEDNWEWIKIGKEAILRNIKLCTRCSMVRIDPDTGIPDPELEPLKTLRTYRKLKDTDLDTLENHAPAIGIYCGLYRTGNVKIGDDIFVYSDDEEKSNN